MALILQLLNSKWNYMIGLYVSTVHSVLHPLTHQQIKASRNYSI